MAKKTTAKKTDAENEALESELTDELTDEVENTENSESEATDEAPAPKAKEKKGKGNIFYVHKIFALCRGNTYVNFTANQEIDFDTFSDEDKVILNALIKDGSLKRTPL